MNYFEDDLPELANIDDLTAGMARGLVAEIEDFLRLVAEFQQMYPEGQVKKLRVRLHGQVWTVHRIHYASDTLSIYRWHDVVAKRVTSMEVARFGRGPSRSV